jgi:DNA-binding MarR family transcriptional regulator
MKARDIDILLGTPARLAITASLAGAGPLTFTQLRQETGLADGNLHVQTRRLVEAGYVDAGKTPSGNRILTTFRLTEAGIGAYRAHLLMIAKPIGGGRFSMDLTGRGVDRTESNASRAKDDSQVW